MELPGTVFIMVGAVVAALVTGLFNLTNLIVSKEDKVSDSRQKWLDSLREESSKLLAVVDTLVRLVEPRVQGKPGGLTVDEIAQLRKDHVERYRDLNEMRFRVLLRLNPDEHKTLTANLSQLANAFYGSCNNIDEIRRLQSAVVEDTQRTLKETWERVKQGEKTFRRMRKALVVVVLMLAGVLVLAPVVFPELRRLSFESHHGAGVQSPATPNATAQKSISSAPSASAPVGNAKSP